MLSLTKVVFSFPSFYHLSPSLASFPFFVLLSLVYSTWAQVSLGRCNLRYGAGTLLLLYIFHDYACFYDAAVMPRFPLPSPFPWSFFCCLSPHMYFYQLSLVSSTCHFHCAACLYPSMCIPYSISPCSLTYMALSLAIVAGVSHHLYLSFDDAP